MGVMFTEHFRIHFHGGEEQVAEEMAHVAERAFDIMTEELQWTPDLPTTEIVLIDNTDIANGYATYLPFNTIVIYITAPDGNSTLSLYEDWNEKLFTHELTHILHMDTIEGATVVFRKILGKSLQSMDWFLVGLSRDKQQCKRRGKQPQDEDVLILFI